MTEKTKKKPLKGNTHELENIIQFGVKLMAENKAKSYIIKELQAFSEKSTTQTYRYYKMCLEKLQGEYAEDVKHIRNKKIKSFERDMELAFAEYENCIDPKDKAKWFDTYISIKFKMDKYFKDQLMIPEEKDNDLNINISYSKPE